MVVSANLPLFAGAATGVSQTEHDHMPTARLASKSGGVQMRTAQKNRLGPAAQLYRDAADGLDTAFAR